MRMVHYYAGLAAALACALVATLWTGAFHDGSDRHLVVGLFTAILAVATNTLLILFMIVTGRILKAAVQARSLPSEFLAELNAFFARRSAYPLSILGAFAAAAAAVLGHGRFIGVPDAVHVLVGLAAAVLNLSTLGLGVRTLRENQALMDRAVRELDRLDAAGERADPAAGEPRWSFGRSARWLIFAASAWAPYLYWGVVAERGDFGRVAAPLPLVCALASLAGIVAAWRSRRVGAGTR